jgi:uncharacterized protein YbbK (DUF523 family)/uncharacterized protein YbgA (DUF1722 family)
VSGPPGGTIRIGVSACLLGQRVRYDGGHKRDAFVTDTLARFFTLLPVCPEVEAGLGLPRESMRLVESPAGRRLVAPRSGRDLTGPVHAFAAGRSGELAALDLGGFVFKKDSPTCGLHRVRVLGSGGQATRSGRGLFAEALCARLPLLPVEEEGRLNDRALRESFLHRVLAYRRLTDLFRSRWKTGDLVRFHTREKLLLLAYSPVAYRRLGRLVAGARHRPRPEVEKRYAVLFMRALASPPSRGRVVNALQHAAGHFKGLPAAQRGELGELIGLHGNGTLPLLAPLTLLRHHARAAAPYVAAQSWIAPAPFELLPRERL